MSGGAGTLYVASVGSRWPETTVNAGVFVAPWPPEWSAVGKCRVTLQHKGRTSLHIDYGGVQIFDPSDHPGESVMLGIEDADGRGRMICPKATYDFAIDGYYLDPDGALPAYTYLQAADAPLPPSPCVCPLCVQYTSAGRSSTATFTVSGKVTPLRTPRSAPAAPYGGEAVDLVPGRLRGYREWKVRPGVDGRSPRLASITADTVWPWTPTVEAQCHLAAIIAANPGAFDPLPPHDPDLVPYGPCSCGIYARHRPNYGSTTDGRVGGVIEAWGKGTEIGDAGFRARYARLVALYIEPVKRFDPTSMQPSPVDPLVDPRIDELVELGKLYRVPVFDSQRKVLAKFPPCDVSGLLAPEPKPRPTPEQCEHVYSGTGPYCIRCRAVDPLAPWMCACGEKMPYGELANHVCLGFNNGGWIPMGATQGGTAYTLYYRPMPPGTSPSAT